MSQLRELRLIRWIAVVGQIATFLAAIIVLKLALDPVPFVVLVLILVVSNAALHIHSIARAFSTVSGFGLIITLDTLLLAAILYFYGGHANPFSMFFIIHVLLAAIFLNRAWSWGIITLCTLSFALLFFHHTPIIELSGGASDIHSHHHHQASGGDMLSLHLQGMLVSFILISALIGAFVNRIKGALSLSQTELEQSRRNQELLGALATLAAGAAHELRTPLATIALIVDEIRSENFAKADEEGASNEKFRADLDSMQEEVEKCSAIISKLAAQSGSVEGEMPVELEPSTFLNLLRERIQKQFKGSILVLPSDLKQSIKIPLESIFSALCSLIKNAVDFSTSEQPVELRVSSTSEAVRFSVKNHGVVIPADVLARIGEPFYTTRDPGSGMGLGVFLVRLVAKRLGGRFSITCSPSGDTVALFEVPVRCHWN